MLGGMVQQLVNRTRARQVAEENRKAHSRERAAGKLLRKNEETQSCIASGRKQFCDPAEFFDGDSRSGKIACVRTDAFVRPGRAATVVRADGRFWL
jgi:hypothetical protein